MSDELLKPRKHHFRPSEDDRDTCRVCGHNFRNATIHCMGGEGPETDAQYIARLECALRLAAQSPEPVACIRLRPDEIQSGLDRVRWAEGLIRQLPDNHDGRNSWLANYAGDKHDADKIRFTAQTDYEQRIRSALVAPPQSASDGALREALEQIRTVCIDNAGDTVRHDLALKFIGKIASRALAAGEATKSDGGVNGSLPSGESDLVVTQDQPPSDPREPAAVAGEDVYALTAQLREKSNWHSDIHSNLHRKSADVIGALMKERRTRPADVTVKELASSVMTSCSAIWAHEARQIARALLDTYKIGAK